MPFPGEGIGEKKTSLPSASSASGMALALALNELSKLHCDRSEWSECTWKNQGIDKWRKQSAEEQVWHSPTMKFKNDNMNTLINMGVNINPRGKSHMTMHQPIC